MKNENYIIILPNGIEYSIYGIARSFEQNYTIVYDAGSNRVVAVVPSSCLLVREENIEDQY